LNGGIDECLTRSDGKTAPAHFIAKDRNPCYPVPMDRYDTAGKGRTLAVICRDAEREGKFYSNRP
jgi:hypothetical protein